MRLDTFHGPMDIPAFVIYVVWTMVTIFNISLVVFLWPYKKRTLVKLLMSVLCADLIQSMVSIVEAVGINAMREYNWWCSVSVSVEEASWTIAGYSLFLIALEIYFRSTWRRGSKRKSIRGKAGIILLVLWFLSFIVNCLTIPFYSECVSCASCWKNIPRQPLIFFSLTKLDSLPLPTNEAHSENFREQRNLHIQLMSVKPRNKFCVFRIRLQCAHDG